MVEIVPPRPRYGSLDAREKAIADARIYLNKRVAQKPTPAYLVIASLLELYDTDELQRIYRKAGIP